MVSRLPVPGSDVNNWGHILNDFLGQAHTSAGAIKPGAVGAAALQDDAVAESKLDTSVRAKLNAGPVAASAGVAGAVRLAGDLGGTALSPTTPTALHLTGDETKSGSLTFDGSAGRRDVSVTSSFSGGYNNFDSTSRINLHSHQRAQMNNDSNTNATQAHYGEVLRIDIEQRQAKGVIAFRENYLGAAEGPRTVAWLVAHGEANDSTPQNPVWHNHFSIELPDETGALQTSLEFPFAPFNQPNTFGMPTADRYVRAVVGLVAAADIFVEQDAGVNKNIYFSSRKYKDVTGKRWGLQQDSSAESGSNAGANFRINRYNDSGSFVDSPVYIRRSDGQIGIDQTSPSAALDVVGTTELNGAVSVPGSTVSIGNTAAQGGAKLYVEASTSQVGMLFRNTTAGGNVASNVVIQSQTAGSRALQTAIQSDTTNRFSIEVSGLHEWGSGTAARDTNLYRSAADTLKTDDSLVVGGSLTTGYVAKTAAYTLTALDSIVDCTSGTFTATLPTAVGCAGREYTVKNSGSGVVTVGTTSSQQIDGTANYSLATQYKYVRVVSDGANWKIIGKN